MEFSFSFSPQFYSSPLAAWVRRAEREKNKDFVCSAPPLKRDALFSENAHAHKRAVFASQVVNNASHREGRAASNLILPDTFCYSRTAIYNRLSRLQRPFFSDIHSRQVYGEKISRANSSTLNGPSSLQAPSQRNRRRERARHAGCD